MGKLQMAKKSIWKVNKANLHSFQYKTLLGPECIINITKRHNLKTKLRFNI